LQAVIVGWVKVLANRIERELQTREGMHCAIYERDLQRLWLLNEKDREAKIAQFANNYGFRLRFYKKGLCAIFDRWPRGSLKSAKPAKSLYRVGNSADNDVAR
jgi:hypothetical protein